MSKSILDDIMNMTHHASSKGKFKIVSWDDNLPKELHQFKSSLHTVEQVDSKTDNQDITNNEIKP